MKDLLPEIVKVLGTGFSTWLVELFQVYIVRVLGYEPEQPNNWTMLRLLRCTCAHCNFLDMFLIDPEQQTKSFFREHAIRDHLQTRLQHSGGKHDEGFKFSTTGRGDFQTLVIEKRHAGYDRKHAAWRSSAADMKSFMRTLDTKQRLKARLGPSYDNVVNLRIVSLRRSKAGVPVPETYQAPLVWTFERSARILGASSASAAVRNGTETVATRTTTASSRVDVQESTKRKLADDAADSLQPIKRAV